MKYRLLRPRLTRVPHIRLYTRWRLGLAWCNVTSFFIVLSQGIQRIVQKPMHCFATQAYVLYYLPGANNLVGGSGGSKGGGPFSLEEVKLHWIKHEILCERFMIWYPTLLWFIKCFLMSIVRLPCSWAM